MLSCFANAGQLERALADAIVPPLFSLLHASHFDTMRIFVRHKAAVWIELGFTHPLVEMIDPPDGQWLFLRAPQRWRWEAAPSFRHDGTGTFFLPPGSVRP